MADINEILGRNINSIKELKAAMNELKDSLIGVDASSDEYKETSEKLAAAQAELNKVTRAGKDDNDAAADSIRGLEKQYKALYDQYKLLSEEQRNSDFGKNMAESLSALSEKINDTKKEVGNFTSNIGRYAQGATEAFSKMGISLGALQTPMKLAAGGAKTLGASLKALIANPVGAVIMAIVVALKALHAIAERVKKAINDNEETTNRLRVAMATFKPVVDAVSNAFDFLAKIVVKTIENLAKVAEKIMSIIPGMKQAIKSHQDLAKATNDLTKAQREANVENSKKQAEIERLREEASAVEDVTEKRRLLEEAKAMQAEVDQKNVELAQEELRIMEEYAAKTANSAEANDKLAAAQKKVNDAIAQGERNQRMYNKQLSATETKTKSAGAATVNYREQAMELHKQLIEDNKDEITKLTEKYEKEKKLLEKYHLDTTLLTKKYNKEIEDIRKEATLKALQQRKADLEQEWDLLRTQGDEDIALAGEAEVIEKKTIPAVTKLQDKVTEFLKSFRDMSKLPDVDAALAPMKEMEDLINDGGFAALPDKYKDIKDAVAKVNAAFGLNITTVRNLDLTAEGLVTRLEQINKEIENISQTKAGEEAAKRINDALKKSQINLFDELLGYDTGMTSFNEIQNLRLEGEYTILEEQKKLYEQELADFKGTQDQKLELLNQYYSVVEEMSTRQGELQQLEVERNMAILESTFELYESLTSSLNSVFDAISNVMQAEIDSGRLTEREAKRKERAIKRLEAIQLAVSIAGIAASTAGGIMDVWRGYAAELPVNAMTAAAAGPGAAAAKAALDAKSLTSAIIRTATIGTQGAAQIAAAVGGYIAKSQASMNDGSNGGGTVGATPTLIDSTPYSYTRTVQTTEEEDEMNRPIYVTVTDIEEGLGHRATVTNESSF